MSLRKIIERHPLLTIVCLTIIMMLPSLNILQVTIMEARNFITAREMLSEGNWFLTTMNGLPRYEKPPLPSWITALSGWIFGIRNVYALRLPNVIMVSLVGIFTYLFSRLYLEKRHSFINGIVALSSFYVMAITIEAPWDIYTHAFMLITIFYLVRSYRSKQPLNPIMATLFIAFSVLSKGPISLYALLLPFMIAYPLVYGLKDKFFVKTILPLLGGILLGGIWFLVVRLADPGAFDQIAEKETGNWTSYHTRPFYYYWSFFTQSGIWTIPAFIGLLYPYLIKRVSNRELYKLSFFWTIFSLVLLSVIPEKKSRYLVPVLIPLAINTGFYIQYLILEFKKLKSKYETIPVYINFGLLGALGVLFPVLGYYLFKENLNHLFLNYILATVLLVTIGSFLLFHLFKKNILNVFYLTILLLASIMFSVLPSLSRFQNKNKAFAPISNLKAEADKQKLKVYLLDNMSPEMMWDYGAIIPLVERKEGNFVFPNEKRFGLIVNDKQVLLNSHAKEKYTIEEVATYNRNIAKVGARRHTVRNINYFYILSQKE